MTRIFNFENYSKTILLALIVFSHTLFGQDLKKPGFCHIVDDEKAAKNYISQNSREQRLACTADYINVYFHFIRDNSGATGQPTSNVSQYMTILNNAFSGHNIHFITTGFDVINNSTLAATNYDHMTNFSSVTMNHQSNAINIYIFRADKTAATSGGVANRPGTRVAIGGGDTWATNYSLSNVLSHEVGHALNLLHTFNGTVSGSTSGCAENPNGSNGATCGDEVADTPADPNIAFSNAGNCTNPFTMVIGGTTYSPDPTNIMSYATANCLNQFTGGQGTRMTSALTSLAIYPPVRSTISGPSLICTTAAYSIAVPAGTSIAWSSSNTGAVTINSSGIASRVGSYNGSVTINALLTNASGCTRALSKTVSVGAPSNSYTVVKPGYSTACVTETKEVFGLSAGSAGFSVEIENVSGAVLYNLSNMSTPVTTVTLSGFYMQKASGFSGSFVTLRVRTGNACGWSGWANMTVAVGCGSGFTVSPNPATDYITVEFDDAENQYALPNWINLYSEKSTNPIKSISIKETYDNKSFKDTNKIEIDVHDLLRGTYFLHVIPNKSSNQKTHKIRVILE